MARTVAVLGGGVGGLAVDRKLRARLAPADRVVLVERSTWRGSTTGGGDTLPWGTCPRRSSRGGGQRILNLSVLPCLLLMSA